MEPGLKGPNQHIDETLAAMHARPLKTNQGLSPFIAYNINESCVKVNTLFILKDLDRLIFCT